jgi:hypothetical protein
MTSTLWSCNTPDLFWRCQPNPSPEIWRQALQKSLSVLGMTGISENIDAILSTTLGEGQFGPHHWQLSQARRLYYQLKPLFPRWLIDSLKKIN